MKITFVAGERLKSGEPRRGRGVGVAPDGAGVAPGGAGVALDGVEVAP